jgi:predicted aldo/keto reductase-like oxidoreductase
MMQKKRLGRTNLQVSIVGFGGMHIYPCSYIREMSFDDAKKVVRKAFELGINYFDTARIYGSGQSEERIGAALEDVRDQCVLATKTASVSKKGTIEDIKESLNRLRTDRIDLIQLHGINNMNSLKKVMEADGSLESCKEARSRGLVDFIGITGHRPKVLLEAIKTNEFDTILLPLSVVTRQALEELIPVAKDMDVGIVIMKALVCKISNIMTWTYAEPPTLFSDEPDLKVFLGEDSNTRIRNALRWILDHDISTIALGLGNTEQVEWAVKVGEEFYGSSKEEKEKYSIQRQKEHCRDCGLCLPCPQNLNISAILRFSDLAVTYGLRNWATKLYQPLKIKAESCNECGECEPKCPYKLPIISMLKDTVKILS